jgi:beta-glucosidase
MMDVIHGYKTIYPIPLAMGCSFDTNLMEECTRMASEEASAEGVQVTFAPMIDFVRDARWGRVMETCGEDPLLNGIMGATQVKAYRNGDISQPGNLATCVKHFAAYGGAEAGRDYNTVELSERALREFYLPAYKDCIDAGADMLMPSFNTLNGVPAVANEWLMKKILREEWGFDGVVISDYAAVKELINHGVADNLKEAAKLAFENGCHIEMCSSAYIKFLKELVNEGVFQMEDLDEAVLKVLQMKENLGLFEDPYHRCSYMLNELFLTCLQAYCSSQIYWHICSCCCQSR